MDRNNRISNTQIAEVESYLAGGDPFSQIISALEARINKQGFSALNAVEQGYYALADFMGASTNGMLDYYLLQREADDNAGELVHNAVRQALAAIDESALIADYDLLVAGGPQPEDAYDHIGDDDRDTEFVHKQFEIEAKMDDWAERSGLNPQSARG